MKIFLINGLFTFFIINTFVHANEFFRVQKVCLNSGGIINPLEDIKIRKNKLCFKFSCSIPESLSSSGINSIREICVDSKHTNEFQNCSKKSLEKIKCPEGTYTFIGKSPSPAINDSELIKDNSKAEPDSSVLQNQSYSGAQE